MNQLLEMETFVRVVEAGSISGAAERMNVAKSAISRRLGELETRLDVQLLNRTTRRLSLTDAGSAFYERCDRILADVTDAEQCLADTEDALQGRIRVAAPLSFGLDHLGPAINDFMQVHPQLNFEIDFNDREVDLIEEGFDLGVRIAKLSDSSLVARRLTPIRHVVCANPEYWDKHGRPEHPNDLKRHLALRYTNAPQKSWSYQHPDGIRGSVSLPTRASGNNGAFLSQAAERGLGVIRVPVFIAYQAIERGALEPVLTDYRWGDVYAWALYPKTRRLPHRIRVLIDWLVERFGDEPYWEKCLCRSEVSPR